MVVFLGFYNDSRAPQKRFWAPQADFVKTTPVFKNRLFKFPRTTAKPDKSATIWQHNEDGVNVEVNMAQDGPYTEILPERGRDRSPR